MVATALDGSANLMRVAWGLKRDKDGHRDYSVTWQVHAAITDGPQAIMNATGLPAIGSTWGYGGSDAYAYCWPTLDVKHAPGYKPEDPARSWYVEQLFTTRPLDRCQDDAIENPLLEPQGISGSFTRFTREVTRDRWDQALMTSSYQPLKGPEVEFDDGTPTVRIEQNIASLGLSTFARIYNTVNDRTLWGLGPRRVKLSNVSWQRLLYGTCTYYYKRIFGFDINYDTFDRTTPDYSNHTLAGAWDHSVSPPVWTKKSWADADEPSHYMRYKDVNGENSRVLLDGAGEPLSKTAIGTGTGTGIGTADDDIVYIPIEYYQESNLSLLGIPSSIG